MEAFAAKVCVDEPAHFARLDDFFPRLYQKGVIEAVCRSAMEKQGRSFAVLFPRQSGKNELQAHIEAFLLYRLRIEGAEIVKISPTWKPQSQNAMRRLERVLRANSATKDLWSKESGYIYSIGKARIYFLSGSPETNIVGATASTLLEVDEAQDVEIAKFDREIAPMAASTDATRVFWGTAWTSTTLLARELAAARRIDLGASLPGDPSAFVLTADDVAAEVPAYGAYVAREVKKLGRFHPHVRTQYYSETIDGQGGMFPAARVQKMFCATPWDRRDAVYALLIDIGGEELPAGEETPVGEDLPAGEGPAQLRVARCGHGPAATEDTIAGVTRGGILRQPTLWPISADLMGSASPERSGGRRDATALTVVAVDLSGLRDPDLRAPVYHPVARRVWVGTAHTVLYSEIRAIAAAYQARKIVVDATGVGAGLASFLERALPGKVVRFLFTTASKSKLGWDFLALVDAGRWREEGDEYMRNEDMSDGYMSDECMGTSSTHHSSTHNPYPHISSLFLSQLSACQFEVLPGPQHTLRWGVPASARDPLSGALIHDDLLISAALCTLLDKQDWRTSPGGRRKDAGIVQAKDPLEGMKGF